MSTELSEAALNYDTTGVPALRTLPLRLAPLTGESLDSWLEALAAHCDTSWADLLTAVGYAHADPVTTSRNPQLTASPPQLTSLSYTTGTSAEVLQSMTLPSLMRTHGCHSDIRTLVLPRSRFCAQCLIDSGGRWQLWWRLRWGFVCPFHHCLLADACPRCRRQQRVITPPADFVPTPGMCALRALNTKAGGRTPRRCGAPLPNTHSIQLETDDPALQAQRDILSVVDTGQTSAGIYATSPAFTSMFATDLTMLGDHILHHAGISVLQTHLSHDLWRAYRDTTGSAAPPGSSSLWSLGRNTTSAVTAAVAACLAVPILGSTTLTTARNRLAQFVPASSSGRQGPSSTSSGRRRTMTNPANSVLVSSRPCVDGPMAQIRRRTDSIEHRHADVHDGRHRAVPSLLWPSWAVNFSCDDVSFSHLRCALSVALVVVGTDISLSTACAQLGSAISPRGVTRVLRVIHTRPSWPTFIAALRQLATQLDEQPGPIDYHRRRTLLYETLLPDHLWCQICRQLGILRGRGVKVHLYRCWLYERLTGSPGLCSPDAIHTYRFSTALNNLPLTLTPDLITALDAVAQAFLSELAISHEPVRWHPANAIAYRGTSRQLLDDSDIGVLHELVHQDKRSLRAVRPQASNQHRRRT